MKKKIAVLMSTYNGEKYLRAQLDSILQQKCKYPIEIFVRDDGSTDTTGIILREYAVQYDNIHIRFGENTGYNSGFLTLLFEIDGYDFYSFADQDDVWMDNKLESAVSIIEKNDGPVLYGNSSYLVHDDLIPLGVTQQQIKEITVYNTMIQNFLPGHSQVMNNALRVVLLRKLDYSRLYIYDSWITLTASVFGKIIFDNNPHTYYRIHQGNDFGFGTGPLSWLKERIRRVLHGHAGRYMKQLEYFIEIYGQDDSQPKLKIIKNFTFSKSNIIFRICYSLKDNIYRQRSFETVLFKLMYVVGIV